jgi:hypothetical protein
MPDTKSPLARLVLFMVCLAIAGSCVAGVHYYTVDLPQQQSQTAPENSHIDTGCMDWCTSGSMPYYICYSMCNIRES